MGSAFQTLLHIQRMSKKETDELLFIYLFIYLSQKFMGLQNPTFLRYNTQAIVRITQRQFDDATSTWR